MFLNNVNSNWLKSEWKFTIYLILWHQVAFIPLQVKPEGEFIEIWLKNIIQISPLLYYSIIQSKQDYKQYTNWKTLRFPPPLKWVGAREPFGDLSILNQECKSKFHLVWNRAWWKQQYNWTSTRRPLRKQQYGRHRRQNISMVDVDHWEKCSGRRRPLEKCSMG